MGLSTVSAFKHIGRAEGTVEVSGKRLRDLQSVLTTMLEDVNSVCQKYEVPYTLGGGTCLGAVRHHGFIPWDDDIDINMTRSGFHKFQEAFKAELSDRYWLHVPGETPGYELAFPRIRLKGTVVRSREDYELDECGAYIDIFFIDNAPNSRVARFAHGFISMALGLLYSCRRFAAHGSSYLSLVADDRGTSKIFKRKIFIGKLLSFKSVEDWTSIWDRWNGLCRDENSCYLCIPVGRNHYFGETYRRDSFFPSSNGQFDDLIVPLPHDVDSYLRALYGNDYMLPPSQSDQETHVVYEFDLGAYAPDES